MANPALLEEDRLRDPRGGILTSRTRPTAAAAPSVTAYDAGQSLRGAGIVMNAVGERALDAVKRPGEAIAGALSEVGRGFLGAPRVALRPTSPAPATAAAPPAAGGMHLIEPSNASSMRVAPPSAGFPVARRPAAAPAAADPVVGNFNGRDITRSQTEALAGGVAAARGGVSTGPNDSVVYTPAADPSAAAPAVAAPPVAVRPAVADQFVGRQLDQDREARRRAIGDVDDQLFRARLHAGTRGGRNLIAQLVATKAGIIDAGERVDAGLAGGDRDATNTTNVASMQEQGQNARSAARTTADLQVEGVRQAGETARQRIAQRPERVVTADSSIGLVSDDGSFKPVVGPDGKPVRAPASRDTGGLTADALLKSYTDQRAAILDNINATPEQRQASLAALDADPLYASLRGAASGGAAGGAPPVAGARRAPDGKWYVQNADGSYSMVTP